MAGDDEGRDGFTVMGGVGWLVDNAVAAACLPPLRTQTNTCPTPTTVV